MTKHKYLQLLGAPALLAACVCALATEWQTTGDSNTVTMYVTKQGQWINGNFEDFTAEIAFDPADPGAGSIVGVVQTNSITADDDQNAGYIRQYLETDLFTEARFESTAIVAVDDYFKATGDLTLRDVTKPITLDFAFTPGQQAHFSGQMVIDRYEFGIGEDVDPSWGGQEVTVQIELDLSR